MTRDRTQTARTAIVRTVAGKAAAGRPVGTGRRPRSDDAGKGGA